MSIAIEIPEAADEKMVTISLSELEALVWRVALAIIRDEIRDELRVESRDAVRAAVCEEMKRAFGTPLRKLMEEWEHQGPYDPEGDDLLLADALEIIEKYKAAREEMKRALFELWTQEGEDDPREDEILLRDALEQIKKYGDDHSSFITLEELEAELAAENNAIQSQNRAGGA